MSKEFFESLYDKQPAGLTGNFDAAVTRLVDKQGNSAVTGDQALQSLMLSHVLSIPETAAKGREFTAALAGIKQQSVDRFTKAFPGVSLDKLVETARAAGHTVEVLSTR